MSEEQTVVDQTDTPAAPKVEEGNAQDLDSLLSEYKPGEPKDPPESDGKPDEALTKLSEKVNVLESQIKATLEDSAAKAFESTVKSIKGDLPFSEKMVGAYLQEEARKNPALRNAYLDRERNPQKWTKIEEHLRKELKAEMTSFPSKDATNIANQVDSAVRNAKPQTPNQTPGKLHQLSDAEFDKEVQRMAKSYAT